MVEYRRCAHWRGCDENATIQMQYLWFCEEHAAEVAKHRSEIIFNFEKEKRRRTNPRPKGKRYTPVTTKEAYL